MTPFLEKEDPDPIRVKDAVLDYFDYVGVETITSLWNVSPGVEKDRLLVLQEAVDMYNQGFYYGCTSTLMCQIAGIRPEEWTPSYAGKSARMDFLLKGEGIVIGEPKNHRIIAKYFFYVLFFIFHLYRYEHIISEGRGGSKMFGDRVKLKMTPEEIKIMVYALNELRNKLIEENRYTDAVDDLLLRLCDC